MSEQTEAPDKSQRIDRWLWCARIFKSRSLASQYVEKSGVRVTRRGTTQRVSRASFGLRVGDIVLIKRGSSLATLEMLALADRRGPASEAQTLYRDLTPPAPPELADKNMEPRSTRPNNRDRREQRRLKQRF